MKDGYTTKRYDKEVMKFASSTKSLVRPPLVMQLSELIHQSDVTGPAR